MAANIERIRIELVGGEHLTITQDGDTVVITADTDAEYEVMNFPRKGSTLELRFRRWGKARGRNGKFTPLED